MCIRDRNWTTGEKKQNQHERTLVTKSGISERPFVALPAGADPGFGRGAQQMFQRIANGAQQIMEAKLLAGVQGPPWALEALSFIGIKYLFSYFPW